MSKIIYYGYQCYSKNGEPLGWLYTFSSDTEYAWTNRDLHLCKRWKTPKGAEKHFEQYNGRWQLKSKGGYLKIEVMPEFTESKSSAKSNQQLWREYDQAPKVIVFKPQQEILKWLEQERCVNDDGQPESDGEVLNRKLTELMKLGEDSKQ
jgi:hypothetical protein